MRVAEGEIQTIWRGLAFQSRLEGVESGGARASQGRMSSIDESLREGDKNLAQEVTVR